MTEIMAVTSFSQKGFEDYGQVCLESMVEYWPGPITVYYENQKPDFTDSDKITWKNLYDDQELVEVLKWAKDSPALQGVMPNGDYNYNNNLFKFCRKVFAVSDVAMDFSGLLFWLDADIKFHKKISRTTLRQLIGDHYTCFMGRQEYHSECSFVGYNTLHEQNKKFMDYFRWLYTSGAVMSLRGFHDCWAYDKCLVRTKVPALNLTPKGRLTEDVMPTTELAKYMVHLKGRLKYEAA